MDGTPRGARTVKERKRVAMAQSSTETTEAPLMTVMKIFMPDRDDNYVKAISEKLKGEGVERAEQLLVVSRSARNTDIDLAVLGRQPVLLSL